MIDQPLTPVLLTEEEAIRFVAFNKYYSVFKRLEDKKAFTVYNGSITLHFHEGVLKALDVLHHDKF